MSIGVTVRQLVQKDNALELKRRNLQYDEVADLALFAATCGAEKCFRLLSSKLTPDELMAATR